MAWLLYMDGRNLEIDMAYRRVRRIEMTAELAVEMMLGFDGRHLIKSDVPDDLKIISIVVHPEHYNTIVALVHSESFTEVPPGQYIPEWQTTMTTLVLSEERAEALWSEQ